MAEFIQFLNIGLSVTFKHFDIIRLLKFLIMNYSSVRIANETKPLPIDIVFEDIKYNVEVEQNNDDCCVPPCFKEYQIKSILKGVSGLAKGGEMTAIMGASGAGKTTLLNVISCRIPKAQDKVGCASGKLYANNLEYKFEDFGQFGNYVMQNDILLQTLTVRQTIQYVASLKVNQPQENRNAMVEELIKDLKLEKCAETYVGGNMLKGISGGERKRTSIAFELVSNPSVIILDEPTSGLDSLTAFIIIKYLNKLTKQYNKTVILTIHQPSSQIFFLMDRLILLAEGEMVYQGRATNCLDYFQGLGFKCPQFSNPPDYFMSILHHDSQINLSNYPMYFSSYKEKVEPLVQKQIKNKQASEPQGRPHQVSFCQTLSAILKKDWLNTIRNPLIVKLRIIQTVFMALLLGGAYFNLEINLNTSIEAQKNLDFLSLVGFFFFMTMNNLMTALAPVTLVFPRDRQVFLKEESAKLYNTVTFFLSRLLIELPFLLLVPMIYALILYWMVGLENSAERFFTFYLAMFLASLAGNSLGLLLGSTASDPKVVAALNPILIIPFVLFSGYFKNRQDLPVWLGWIEYISPIKYSFLIFVENEMHEEEEQVLVNSLNFNLQLWPAVFILVGICIGSQLLSLLFLHLGRTKLQ